MSDNSTSTKPKISVIIPVYNVQNYLRACLDSIKNQTLKEIEIICIDDGSTDDSGEILKEYAQKDERIIIFTQKNKGLGAARNKGFELAKGDYISLIDADDIIVPQTYFKTYKKAVDNDADIVIFNSECIFTNESPLERADQNSYYDVSRYFQNRKIPDTFTYKDIKDHLLNICFTVWNKIYRTEFLKRNNIIFLENVVFEEDSPFHIESIMKAKSISFINEKFYHHRVNIGNSISQKERFLKEIESILNALERIKEVLIETNTLEEFKDGYCDFLIWKFKDYMKKITDVDIEQEFLKRFKEHTKMLQNIGAEPCPDNQEAFDTILNIANSSDEYIAAEYERTKKEAIQSKIGYLESRVKYHQKYKKLFFALWMITIFSLVALAIFY